MKSIDDKEFFRELAMASGISDLDVVKRVYYGLVRVMGQQLKARQKIRLPDWGEFSLKVAKSRRFKSVTGEMGILPPLPTVKWKAYEGVKKYFHSLGL
jgi:nucleoid DNA-binding protein